MGKSRIPFGFSLASRLGNAQAPIFQSSGLKNKKSAQASLADFFVLIPGCAKSVHRGDAENRTRVQTSSQKDFYILSSFLIFD
jgi:hypothetical protein